MNALDIVLLVLAALLALLVYGGVVAARRQQQARDAALRARIASANEALADARAQDNGWDLEAMEAAARAAWKGGRIEAVHLVQVIDRPGIDADEAVFRIVVPQGRDGEVVLARTGGAWSARTA